MLIQRSGLLRRLGLGLLACGVFGVASGAAIDGVTGAGGRQENQAVAIIEVNVVPVDSERVLTRQSVVVQGDRITAIGPADELAIPDGAIRVEARGKYLIPGLVDAHAHLLAGERIAGEFVAAELAVMVANGVTTARIPTGSPDYLVDRERIADGDLLGPTLYVGSPPLVGPESGGRYRDAVVTTPREGAAAVRRFDEAGYDFIRLTFGITTDVYEAVVLTARGARIPVIGRVGAEIGLLRALQAGQQIEHLDGYLEALVEGGLPAGAGLSGPGVREPRNWESLDRVDTGRIEAVVRATIDAEVWNTPTLAFLNTAFGTGKREEEIPESSDDRFVSPSVREELWNEYRRFWADPPPEDARRRYVELRNRITLELFRAGGRLMAGSDAPGWMLLDGFNLHRELESFVEAGLPPFGALWAATRSPAGFLSRRDSGRTEYATVEEGTIRFATAITNEVDFGSVAVGKRADLVLLAANPLDDIRNTRRIEGVLLRGRWLPRPELDRLLDAAAAELSRAPLLPADER